jgi:hypothetical protein
LAGVAVPLTLNPSPRGEGGGTIAVGLANRQPDIVRLFKGQSFAFVRLRPPSLAFRTGGRVRIKNWKQWIQSK